MSSLAKYGSFHSRYQVKWKRRRQGKTDYQARKKLIFQDKRKYNTPKLRLVVRITKRNILCQLVSAKIKGDEVLKAVTSKKLTFIPKHLARNNFAAAYIIGLKMSKEIIQGTKNSSLEYSTKRKSPNLILDIGLKRATTGGKIFATMKGVVDGGIFVPHNEKKFPGYKKGEIFQEEKLKNRLVGDHVFSYLDFLKEEDEDRLVTQFPKFNEMNREGNAYLQIIKKFNE